MNDYEFLEHTADVGLRVFGDSEEDLFKSAAIALFSLITDYIPEPKTNKKIDIESETIEDLLVNWLGEMVALLFAEHFLVCKFNIAIKRNQKTCTLVGVLSGDVFDPSEQKIKNEVKAATYHNLHIEKKQNRYQAEIIFDL